VGDKRRTRITIQKNQHVVVEQDIEGTDLNWVDLSPIGVVAEERVNADGSVRVALVFDCDFDASADPEYAFHAEEIL
jgi:hypothetical protein